MRTAGLDVLLPGVTVRARHVVERNVMWSRRLWWIVLSGFFEPLFYLFSVAVGIDALVGTVDYAGRTVDYTDFVAPALLAASAMNGAVFETTMHIYAKLHWQKVYDTMLATPLGPGDIALGELGWALIRGSVYAVGFVVVMTAMGLVHSWWAVLAVPAAVLIGAVFGSLGLYGTSYMRSWLDFDYATLIQISLFLFSATFYPLSTYPAGLQWVVRATPLYHGVEIMRELVLGAVDWTTPVHAAYLVVLLVVALHLAVLRFRKLLVV